MLADFGMDVVTVAAPNDPMGAGISLLQRNKRSVTLNLKEARGRELFLALADNADVVLEGFRPGVVRRLGIDYETLAARNPRIVYCSISGYGQDGPYKDIVGHDLNYLGVAGVAGIMGAEGGPPIVPGVQIGDLAGGGLMAAVGILTALVARAETERGQFVDISMTDGALAVNVTHALFAFAKKRQPLRGGTQLTGRNPCYAIYETKDGKYVTVGAVEPHFWRNLCKELGFEEYAEQQYAEGPTREEMFRRFRAKFREQTRDEWVAQLRPLDICFGPVLDIDEVERDPQVVHRGMMPTIEDPKKGPMKTIGPPIKLSETPATIRTPPARFGEHTAEVLAEIGIGAGDLEDLRRASVI